MKYLLTIGFLILTGGLVRAPAQSPLSPLQPMRSVSGQFHIYDRRVPTALRLPERAEAPPLLNLEPTFLVVSCERIKQALHADLGAGRDWSGGIHISIRSVQGRQDAAQINAERLGARWNYRVELPERMARDQFARTLVQVLLLELANRSAADRSAEIPLWLSEGLTQQLLASREAELILPPPTLSVGAMLVTPTQLEKRDPDALTNVRQVLRDQPGLTLAELSWPTPENFSRNQAEVFQCSAQLFTAELLRLKQGRENLRRFIALLPEFYNWQTAFLRAYQDHFPNQLALEKWWALQSAYFVGRDHQQLWTMEESAQKLEALLQATVAIRAKAGELPARTDVSLQVVLRDWDTPRQLSTVQAKLSELAQARRRVAPPFMTLVNDYATVLDDYLTQRTRSSATFGSFFSLSPSVQKVTAEAMQRLDALDTRRALIIATNSTNPTVANDGATRRK
jgi:hypothetical protein